MGQVRKLVAPRVTDAPPLVLRADQRVSASGAGRLTRPPRTITGHRQTAIRSSAARLTAIDIVDPPRDVLGPPVTSPASHRADQGPGAVNGPDLTAIRAMVCDVLRDEFREGMARHLSDELYQRLREDLDRRLRLTAAG